MLYVADDETGLLILDATDPSAPVLVGQDPTRCTRIYVSNGLAFVGGFSKLRILNVSDPASVKFISSWDLPGEDGEVTDIVLSGPRAFIAFACDSEDIGGMQVLDVAFPPHPELLGEYLVGEGAVSVSVADGVAFLSTAYAPFANPVLHLLDVGDPTSPLLLSTVEGSLPYDVAASDGTAFVAGNIWGGLAVFDVSDPTSPNELVSVITPPTPTGVTVSNGVAFVGCSDNLTADNYGVGLDGAVLLFDVSEPHAPQAIGTFVDPLEPSGAGAVFLVGDLGYFPQGDELAIVDFSEPSAPDLVGKYETGSNANAVCVIDGVAYLASTNPGFETIDVTDATAPTLLGVYDAGDAWGRDVEVVDNVAYVAYSTAGLLMLDVADPAAPMLLGAYDTGYVPTVDVADGIAYLGGHNVFSIVDVHDPRAPTLVGTYDLSDTINDVFLSGNHAYLALDDLGLGVLNVSEPSEPILAGLFDLDSSPTWSGGPMNGVVVSDNIAYVAHGKLGLLTFDVTECTSDEPCPADCNGDSAINIFDFLCFQGLVTEGDPAADCNADSAIDILDFLCFQGLVTQGCP